MVTRGPEPERSPQKKIEDAASKIVNDFRAKVILKDSRRIVCDEDEVNVFEMYVSNVSLETVIQMNLKMAEDMAKTTDKIDITPLFFLENS